MNTALYRSLAALLLAGLLTACQTPAPPEVVESASFPAFCPEPLGFPWSTKLLGSPQFDYANGAATDGEICAIYSGGSTQGALPGQIHVGLSDAFVTRTSTSGAEVWTQQLGDVLTDVVTGVAVDSEHNVYAVGYTFGTLPLAPNVNQGLYDAFLLKFDADGNHLWTRQLGSSGDDLGFGIAIDAADDIYIVGETDALLPKAANHAGGNDIFVAKYLGWGFHLWTSQLGTDDDESAYGVAVGTAGNVYVVGKTDGTLNAADGHQGGDDLVVGKFRPDGSQIWLHQRGTSSDDAAFAVAVNDDARVFVVGTTEGALDGNVHLGDNDVVVLRYNANGTWRWTDQRGTDADDRGLGVAVHGSSGPYTVGSTGGSLDGNASAGSLDTFLMKHGRGGAWRWTEQFGSSDADGATSIAFNGSDDAYVVGGSSGDLGGAANAGSYDAFAIKYDGDGVLR